jgi:molybdopterin molybdotransferase
MITFDQAVSIVLENCTPSGTVKAGIDGAAGKILAQDVISDTNMPPFNRAAMDGYAFRAKDAAECGILKIVGTVAAGEVRSKPVPLGGAVRILTGAPVPADCDTVLQQEKVISEKDERITINAKIEAGMNIASMGEEIKDGQTVLKKGTIVTPPVSAVLAQVGGSSVEIYPVPVAGILTTGSELANPEDKLKKGQTRESNSCAIYNQCTRFGANPVRLGSASDNSDSLEEKISDGLKHDLLVITGGVSVGKFDLVPDTLKKSGVDILFHKVSQKPGKPILFGKKGNTLVFGLPGNPVAALVCFELYVGPAIRHLSGEVNFRTEWTDARLESATPIDTNRTLFKWCKINTSNGQMQIHPVKSHGSADIMSVAGTDGLARFDEGKYTLGTDVPVKFAYWR